MEHRRNPRHRCNIGVIVKFGNGASHTAEVVNISDSGMCIAPDRPPAAWKDDEVDIRCPELGCVTGTVRWRRGNRIGVEFHPTTDLAAKIAAFKKFYFSGAVKNPAPQPATAARPRVYIAPGRR